MSEVVHAMQAGMYSMNNFLKIDRNQNKNCLLVIGPRTILHQDLWLGELVPIPHKRSKRSN